jgi:hypothetical protein
MEQISFDSFKAFKSQDEYSSFREFFTNRLVPLYYIFRGFLDLKDSHEAHNFLI